MRDKVAELQGGTTIGATSAGDATRPALALDVRHDLRHSASTIMMLVATLEDALHDVAERAALDGITHCARSIQDLVNELDLQSTAECVDLAVLATEAGERAALLYPGSITVQTEPALVVAHELDISRLLTNLVQNACRAAGPDGIVHVTVTNEGSWCVLRIADSGPGFAEKSGPTGLGLALVAAITVRLKGQVTLGRAPLGGGLVAVHLPRLEPATPAEDPEDPAEERSR